MIPGHRLNHKVRISIELEDYEGIFCLLCQMQINYAAEPVVMYAEPKINGTPTIAMYHPSCYSRIARIER